MKKVVLCLTVLFLSFAAGCEPKEPNLMCSIAQADGLRVSMDIPKRHFAPGENFDLTIKATNMTKEPILITAPTAAPVYVRLWRNTSVGWERIKSFPQTENIIVKEWTLAPRETREFKMVLSAQPDWPQDEMLKLSAEINGKNKISPMLTIDVMPPAKTK